MIRARLKGLAPSAEVAGRVFHPGDPAPPPDFNKASLPIEIADARILQAGMASEAACFAEHGFALLDHPTAFRGWGADPAALAAAARDYHPEIEAVVRERLFPGRRVEVDQTLLPVYRGGEEDAVYADWVHQDFGLTAADFALNLAGIVSPEHAENWHARYQSEDVVGCAAVSFWRTIGMREPLRHMPLVLCDPATVAMADVIGEGGNRHISLRYHDAQRWYHYPGMRSDEVLAFKLFEARKDDPAPHRLYSVFHAAFADPGMPEDAERRRSCEHRAVVMILSD